MDCSHHGRSTICLDALRSGNLTGSWVQGSGTQDQASVIPLISIGGGSMKSTSSDRPD